MDIDKLNYLAIGTSKALLPVYASCLHSDGNNLITCNDDVLVKVKDDDIPFVGSVNFLVLYNILKSISRDYNITSKNSKLIISDENSIGRLPIMNMHYPIVELEEDIEYLEITEELYNIIKMAFSFKGKDVYSNIIISKDKIISTDKSRLFVHTMENRSPIKVGINSSIFSILKIGNKIGVDKHDNVILKFEDGFGKFTVEPVDNFPVDKILEFVDGLETNKEFITDISNIQKACNKVSPILLNESDNSVTLRVEDGKFILEAESIVNGNRKVTVNSSVHENFKFSINYSFFKNIPNGFDAIIGNSKVILIKGNTLIVLMGLREEE